MKIVLAAEISGTRDGKAWPPRGTEVDLPDDEARAMIRAGSAVAADDDQVAVIRGEILDDVELAGAPAARDFTAGQPDTNLRRARALAKDDSSEATVREAAKRTDLDDEHTVPSAIQAEQGPVVGDGQPNPTDADAVRKPAGDEEQATASTAGVETATTKSRRS